MISDLNVLVTGGAGYIGSHLVQSLLAVKANVVVLDNLSSGFKEAVSKQALFIEGDVQDTELVSEILAQEKINAIIHLAAYTSIPESRENPLKYYQNNTQGMLSLLHACQGKQVKYFIFSSTAAVYKDAPSPIDEDYATRPHNAYGFSKLMSEQILKDVSAQLDLKYVILRYFNVAGAQIDGQNGQRTKNATHLIKVAIETAYGKRSALPVYGNNYPTPDGTCVRDFIHVCDLANAHVQALDYLRQNSVSQILNCGYGKGYSVQEVIQAVEKVTGAPLTIRYEAPRSGDLPIVIANPGKIKQLLNWRPQYDDLEIIVKTAWEFEKIYKN